MAGKKTALTAEEKLARALVPQEEWPYELPKGWVWTYGKILFLPMESVRPEGDTFHYIDIETIDNQNQTIKTPKLINTVSAPSRASRKLHSGDTLFSLVRPYLKNIGYVNNSLKDCIASTGFFVCSPRDGINSRYIYWLMCSPYVIDGLNRFMKGDNSPSIRKTDIENYYFPLPPLLEQQRIVDKIQSLFARLDEARDKLQQVLEGTEARRAAILHEAFSGGWGKKNSAEGRGKSEEGDGLAEGTVSVPKGWKVVKLSEVCTINPKKLNVKDKDDKLKVSFFPMASLDEELGEITKPEIKDLVEVKKGFTNFQEGDVVFAKITPCMENGKAAVIGPLVNQIGYGTTEFYVLRCHDDLYNRFLFHLVRSIKFRSDAKAHMTGAVGQQRVPKDFMEQYEFLLPPMEEQIKLIKNIDGLFQKEYSMKKATQSALAQIDLLKKAILARAFRGELGTGDPNDPSALDLLEQSL